MYPKEWVFPNKCFHDESKELNYGVWEYHQYKN